METPEIPAWPAKPDAPPDTDHEWIAKYRRALESSHAIETTQRAALFDATIRAARFLWLNLGKMQKRWRRPPTTEPNPAIGVRHPRKSAIAIGVAEEGGELTKKIS